MYVNIYVKGTNFYLKKINDFAQVASNVYFFRTLAELSYLAYYCSH